jgi:hypothetical protein
VKGHHEIDVGEGGLEEARPIGFVKRTRIWARGKDRVFASKRLDDGSLAIYSRPMDKKVSPGAVGLCREKAQKAQKGTAKISAR